MNTSNTIYKNPSCPIVEVIKPHYLERPIIADFSKTKYLSEIEGFDSLPKNCLFDKGHTGVGGTTLALRSPENYCILMPFYKLVQQKGGSESILTVYSKTEIKHIQDYCENQKKLNEPIKLVGTFNALPKILRAIPEQLKNINLLVDEFQILRDTYDYRKDAVEPILKKYKLFASYCFMSATLIQRRFMFQEMYDMKKTEVIFENLAKPNVKIITSNEKTLEKVSEFIDKQVSKGKNVFCFLNHIGTIQQLINNNPNITVENCNVIYSEYNSKEVKDSNGNVFNRKPDLNVLRPFNFLTETAYSGIDINDEHGVNVLVSLNACQDYTYHHPDLVKQIVGRNRLLEKKEIYHFVEFKKPKLVTSEDFDAKIFKQQYEIKKHVKSLNALKTKEEREKYYLKNIKSHSEKYLNLDSDFNASFSNLETLTFEAYDYYIDSLYWSLDNLKEAYEENIGYHENGWIVEIVEDASNDVEEFKNKKRGRRVNKNRILEAILEEHGENFEDSKEYKAFLEKNELYKEVIENNIRKPKDIVSQNLSKKQLQMLLNDFQAKGSNFDLILNRIKQEKSFEIGNKVTAKQAIYLLAKIREDVFFKSRYKILSPDGNVLTTLEKLDFSNDIQMVNGEPVKKLVELKNVESPVKPSILLKEPYNNNPKDLKIWNYLNVKNTSFRADEQKVKGFIIESYKII